MGASSIFGVHDVCLADGIRDDSALSYFPLCLVSVVPKINPSSYIKTNEVIVGRILRKSGKVVPFFRDAAQLFEVVVSVLT